MTERERLIELLDQNCGYVEEQKAEKLADYLLSNKIIRTLDDASIADVQEVKHGKWEYDLRDGVYSCTICGNIDSNNSNYCSLCGAKMDKEVWHD